MRMVPIGDDPCLAEVEFTGTLSQVRISVPETTFWSS